MGLKIGLGEYRKLYYGLTRPGRLVSVDRYAKVWAREYLGEEIQFIQRYTDPLSLLVIVGERALRRLLGI